MLQHALTCTLTAAAGDCRDTARATSQTRLGSRGVTESATSGTSSRPARDTAVSGSSAIVSRSGSICNSRRRQVPACLTLCSRIADGVVCCHYGAAAEEWLVGGGANILFLPDLLKCDPLVLLRGNNGGDISRKSAKIKVGYGSCTHLADVGRPFAVHADREGMLEKLRLLAKRLRVMRTAQQRERHDTTWKRENDNRKA